MIDGLGLGGAERMLVDLANRTVADGHLAFVCITRSSTVLAPALDPRIEVLVLDRKRRISPIAFARLARWARAHRIQVVHAHMRSSTALVVMLHAMHALPQPIVFHDHFYGSIESERWFRYGHRYLARYVAVFERVAESARRAGMPAARVTSIPNGIDLSRLAPSGPPRDLRRELGLADDTALAVIVASLRREKSIEMLLEAVARTPRLHLAIIGPDGDPAYAVECRTLARGKPVTFLGPSRELPEVLPSADLGVLSSHSESGPLALIEYLAAGLPIAATLVGDIGHRLAALGVLGFVPPGDVDALACELSILVAMSPAQRRARGAQGRALVAQWDLGAVMPRWYELYRAAIAERR